MGYRWHDTKKIKPQFAFGYGLSYTDFEIGEASTDKKAYRPGEDINISTTVTNIGSTAGAEVLQVYVGKPKSKVDRAVKELKAFQKIELAPGTSEKVELSIQTNDLAFYDESISDWNLETGNYVLYIGNASDNISRKIKISIE